MTLLSQSVIHLNHWSVNDKLAQEHTVELQVKEKKNDASLVILTATLDDRR